MTDRRNRAGLSVDAELDAFVSDELLHDAGIDPETFWAGTAALIAEFAPRIRAALDRRGDLQTQLDRWHQERPGQIVDFQQYIEFLTGIGYLVAEPDPSDTRITTDGVDDEIAVIAGPQLVVPLTNERFAANAANARWGSLYDALYGTDAIPREGPLAPGSEYNPIRGRAAIAWGRRLLDDIAPLEHGSHADATGYSVSGSVLRIALADGHVGLRDPHQFIGYRGDPADPNAIVLANRGLHLEILIDHDDQIGSSDPAGVRDIILESAVTTIMDLEDSVSAVDAADKVVAYRTWLKLMTGTLEAPVEKGGRSFIRTLDPDRPHTRPDGTTAHLPGRSLQFVRHVGHSMFTDAVLDRDGRQVPEGLLDAVITVAAALPDLRGRSRLRNSRTHSMYIVKPKMHGPEEVTLTVDTFAAVERMLGLPARTLKIGIMDEERRTTLNLAACVAAARDRVVFINTGFLDRTGDEIHTSSAAGPFPRKAELRVNSIIGAYEDHNVDVGLAAGFSGRAQIGKGMWAMTDLMAAMLEQKRSQLWAGASTAWVPSPTAATLHATHYHRIDVAEVQRELVGRARRGIRPILDAPIIDEDTYGTEDRLAELHNNVQSILGYVVRWIDRGIGCSKVPDLSEIALMEDRATLRISSQLLGNWLRHGLISRSDVLASLDLIAPRVDAQNADDPAYRSIGNSEHPTLAYKAARDLILDAPAQPSGYTEPILHSYRRQAKAES